MAASFLEHLESVKKKRHLCDDLKVRSMWSSSYICLRMSLKSYYAKFFIASYLYICRSISQNERALSCILPYLNECCNHMDPEEVACVLAVKLGPRTFTWITDMLAGLPKLPNKIEETIENGLFQAVGLPLSGKEIKDAFAALRKAQISSPATPTDLSLRLCDITKLPLQSPVLSPPTGTCLDYGGFLSNHNKPVEVTFFTTNWSHASPQSVLEVQRLQA